MDYLSRLPDELLDRIFAHLLDTPSPSNRLDVLTTCQRFNRLFRKHLYKRVELRYPRDFHCLFLVDEEPGDGLPVPYGTDCPDIVINQLRYGMMRAFVEEIMGTADLAGLAENDNIPDVPNIPTTSQNAEPVTQAAVDTEHAEMSGPTSEDRNTSSGLAEMQGALQALDVQDDPQVSDQDPEQVQEGLSAHMMEGSGDQNASSEAHVPSFQPECANALQGEGASTIPVLGVSQGKRWAGFSGILERRREDWSQVKELSFWIDESTPPRLVNSFEQPVTLKNADGELLLPNLERLLVDSHCSIPRGSEVPTMTFQKSFFGSFSPVHLSFLHCRGADIRELELLHEHIPSSLFARTKTVEFCCSYSMDANMVPAVHSSAVETVKFTNIDNYHETKELKPLFIDFYIGTWFPQIWEAFPNVKNIHMPRTFETVLPGSCFDVCDGIISVRPGRRTRNTTFDERYAQLRVYFDQDEVGSRDGREKWHSYQKKVMPIGADGDDEEDK